MNYQLSYYNYLYMYNSAKANLEKAIGKNLMFGEELIEMQDVDSSKTENSDKKTGTQNKN